jgi:epoxyqueuosine reductase
MRTLTQAIKEEAYRLGFHLVGVTTPDPPPHVDTYRNWLEKGHHAGMAWMATSQAREKRADPRKILPDCKSILVLGIRYPKPPLPYQSPENATENQQPGCGKIASYALGYDYHDVLPERLRALVVFMETVTGKSIPNRWYTDTGPVLEKELAQRAGLGWIGKNTCLIHPKIGSYFLLAEILLGLELEIDDPFEGDHCGSCNRCLDHCPTGCISQGRTINANQCISYLTIEHRGEIPEDMRPKLGDWLFGCDICQQVCPWNQKIALNQHEAQFSARPGVPPGSLVDELSLTPEEFNLKYKGSPIKRTKRRGYLRNVALAIGNRIGSHALPALVKALEDPEPLIRGHAAWALGRSGKSEALEVLNHAYHQEKDPTVMSEIEAAVLHFQR